MNNYEDGRRKNFFYLAVNLLDLTDIKVVLARLDEEITLDATPKEKALLVVRAFQKKANEREIPLELRK